MQEGEKKELRRVSGEENKKPYTRFPLIRQNLAGMFLANLGRYIPSVASFINAIGSSYLLLIVIEMFCDYAL